MQLTQQATPTDMNVFYFDFNDQDAARWLDDRTDRLTTYLEAASPAAWMWCFRCERAFQLEQAQTHAEAVSCGYADCDAAPIDFWRWESYRAYVGAAPAQPQAAQAYPLALARAA